MTDAQPNLHRRRLGQALRGLREAAGFSLTEAAAQLGMAKSALSKVELGKQRVPQISLAGYFELYGCSNTERAAQVRQLGTLAARGTPSNLLDKYSKVIHGEFAAYLDMEEMATKNDSYSLTIPGLLQTEEYAHALVAGSRKWRTKTEVKAFVKLRMARQEALYRKTQALQVWCVLDEAALHRQIGDSEIMRKQLMKLIELPDTSPHVAIQVLPFNRGSHPGLDGPFHILYFETGAPVVVVEPMTTSLYLEEEQDVKRYERAYNHLRAQALDPDRSRQLIYDTIKDV